MASRWSSDPVVRSEGWRPFFAFSALVKRSRGKVFASKQHWLASISVRNSAVCWPKLGPKAPNSRNVFHPLVEQP
jgi:hypothetical protein